MPPPLGWGIKRWCASICCLSIAYIGPRRELPIGLKLAEVGHVTRNSDTIQRQKIKCVNLHGRGHCAGAGLPHGLFYTFGSAYSLYAISLAANATLLFRSCHIPVGLKINGHHSLTVIMRKCRFKIKQQETRLSLTNRATRFVSDSSQGHQTCYLLSVTFCS